MYHPDAVTTGARLAATATRAAHTLAHLVHWIAPLACAFALSTTIASTAAMSLNASGSSQQRMASVPDPPDATRTVMATTTVILSSVDTHGIGITIRCQTQPSLFAADAVELDPAQLEVVLANACLTWSTAGGPPEYPMTSGISHRDPPPSI
jgi:hypothetical protein